jgi:hypothetical protein
MGVGLLAALAGAGIAGQIGTGIADIWSGNRDFKLQKDVFEYQKAMQKEAWAREDNAVTRRTDDLRRAGLNPVLAAGSAASSSAPIKVGAPQRNLDASSKNALLLGAIKQAADVSMTNASKKLIEKQVDTEAYKQNKLLAETAEIWKRAEGLSHNLGIAERSDLPTGAYSRIFADIKDGISFALNLIPRYSGISGEDLLGAMSGDRRQGITNESIQKGKENLRAFISTEYPNMNTGQVDYIVKVIEDNDYISFDRFQGPYSNDQIEGLKQLIESIAGETRRGSRR